MYRTGLGLTVGPLVLGTASGQLPYTGFSAGGYVLLAVGLLVMGLLLARLGHDRSTPYDGRRRARFGRPLLAVAVAGLGGLLLVFSGWWRGVETWVAAHSIQLVTQENTTGAFQTGIVVLHRGSKTAAAFALTGQCSVAYILGSLLIGGAPLLLLRRLSLARVGSALLLTSLVLMAVNVARLTAIGVAILAWGHDGFTVSHTYLGSLVTFVGTCLAGVAFALVMVAQRRSAGPAATA
jgi:exosortase/archaeosortase family protein